VHTLIWNGTSVEPPVQPDSAPSIQQAFNAYQQGTGGQPRAELWVGETAAAWDSGKPGVTNAFVDSFWFVTQLGSLAQVGVATQCRQSLVGGAYELLDKHTFQPNPDYYIALLWTRLMGRRVIGVTQPGPDTSTPLVRAYAHCSSEGDEEGGGAPAGSIAVAIINADSSATARVDLRGLTQLAPRQEYRLTAPAAAGGGSTESQLHSRSVALNGKTLDMAEDGSLPPLVPVVVTNVTEVLVVHPLEIIFVVFEGADAASCKVL
jgi:heparanase 1